MHGVPRVLMLMLTLGLVAAGPGCGVLRRKAKASDDRFVRDMRQGRRPMGQVVLVEAARGFVLVRSPLASVAQPETTLVVKAQGTAATTGKLKVTPERKKNMIAADIVEGTPKVGEVVYFPTTEKVVSTAPPPVEPGAAPGGLGAAAGPATGVLPGLLPGVPLPPAGEGPGAAGELPPLGEPSGPREAIPDFPGFEPLPEAPAEPLEPVASPDAPS